MTGLLKNGGWHGVGQQASIIVDARPTYQIVLDTQQTGPHAGAEQFKQRFDAYYVLRPRLPWYRLDVPRRTKKQDLIALAERIVALDTLADATT